MSKDKPMKKKVARGKGGVKRKGEAGAARNYITRNQALKKLQCTLSDFRRLCILKGIYPREPKSRKKANKGSSAPASFYYAKDIQYLLHEPVLHKLREHKTFAKKLSRAIGRGEWALAKNLEESKPVYRIDHIIKERYPTFTDSLRDLDDALSLIVLFAGLPASQTIPASIIANCGRLAAQWQLYVMRTRSLRKVFLSIKGIYFQAEVHGQTINWIVPYMFTQHIPSDLDYRIMLTFLELYQTLLGFVFYKLYNDINLVYPPKLDEALEDNGAGIGALLLEESGKGLLVEQADSDELKERKRVYARDVRKQIKEIEASTKDSAATAGDDEEDVTMAAEPSTTNADELDVFPTTSENDPKQPESTTALTDLFGPYYFFLSREVTRPTLEFCIRSFGGQVGWDPILGAGSPYQENDARITHHVIDRPLADGLRQAHPGKRAYIQPQWVVDCINRKSILSTDDYAPGKTLPPHLSPFVDEEDMREKGGYVPAEARAFANEAVGDEDEEEELVDEEADSDDEEEAEDVEAEAEQATPAIDAAAKAPENEELVHEAELEAERLGMTAAEFERKLASGAGKAAKKQQATKKGSAISKEEQLASIMLTGKQRKLYNKMSFTKQKRADEKAKLEAKKKALAKSRK